MFNNFKEKYNSVLYSDIKAMNNLIDNNDNK